MASNPDKDKKLAKMHTEIQNWAIEGLLPELIEGLKRHSYSAHLPAHHSVRGLLGDSCSKTDILVLSGRDQTDSAGIAKLSLNALLCGVVREDIKDHSTFAIIREPNVVATPHGSLASFATVLNNSIPRPITDVLYDRDGNSLNMRILDVTVDITTWKHDGSPAANTAFCWICTVEVARAYPISS